MGFFGAAVTDFHERSREEFERMRHQYYILYLDKTLNIPLHRNDSSCPCPPPPPKIRACLLATGVNELSNFHTVKPPIMEEDKPLNKGQTKSSLAYTLYRKSLASEKRTTSNKMAGPLYIENWDLITISLSTILYNYLQFEESIDQLQKDM